MPQIIRTTLSKKKDPHEKDIKKFKVTTKSYKQYKQYILQDAPGAILMKRHPYTYSAPSYLRVMHQKKLCYYEKMLKHSLQIQMAKYMVNRNEHVNNNVVYQK